MTQHLPIQSKATRDLPEQLRQISAALWDAANRRDFAELERLLNEREAALSELREETMLTPQQRRELTAVQAADRYLIRQLANELAWLEKRLTSVGQRRRAVHGYRSVQGNATRVSRTG